MKCTDCDVDGVHPIGMHDKVKDSQWTKLWLICRSIPDIYVYKFTLRIHSCKCIWYSCYKELFGRCIKKIYLNFNKAAAFCMQLHQSHAWPAVRFRKAVLLRLIPKMQYQFLPYGNEYWMEILEISDTIPSSRLMLRSDSSAGRKVFVNVKKILHIWFISFTRLPWTKWPPFPTQYFQMHCHEWKVL